MPDIITLQNGDSLLGIAQAGKMLHYTPDIALSHAEFVRRTVGELPDGAWVGTIRKSSGEVSAINSRTFYGNQLPAPAEVIAAVQAMFR